MNAQRCFSFGAASERAHWFRQQWPDTGVSVSHPHHSPFPVWFTQIRNPYGVNSLKHTLYPTDFISVTIQNVERPIELTADFPLAQL